MKTIFEIVRNALVISDNNNGMGSRATERDKKQSELSFSRHTINNNSNNTRSSTSTWDER